MSLGINISKTVDVDAVTEYASQLPGVKVARNYSYIARPTSFIKEDIKKQG